MPTARRLAEFHRLYDGPLPWTLAEAVRLGGTADFQQLHNRALSRHADRLADRARRTMIAGRLHDARLASDAGATAILQHRRAGLAARGRAG